MGDVYYLAAAYDRQAEMRERAADLVGFGSVSSSWISRPPCNDHKYEAELDLLDLDAADTLILFADGGSGGRFVEFGYALATKKHTIIIGHVENIFGHLAGAHFDTWADFLKAGRMIYG